MSRRLIGFDPGSRLCGWGVVDAQGRKVHHVDNGVIVLPAKKPLTERIGILVPKVRELIATYRPHRAAAEQIIFVRNVRAAVALAQVRGHGQLVPYLISLSMNMTHRGQEGGNRSRSLGKRAGGRDGDAIVCCLKSLRKMQPMRWLLPWQAACSAMHQLKCRVWLPGVALARGGKRGKPMSMSVRGDGRLLLYARPA